ncbi:MAG TPA: VOC family protein [Gemmatimonadaceae bacterium]|nr:VOC family protein [Gemmatimonadaceae bacterium]
MVQPLAGVLEACLYADDLDAAHGFYAGALGLEMIARDSDRHLFFRAGASTMFLVFNAARTSQSPDNDTAGAIAAPPHGATGPGHVAFTVADAELDDWRSHLAAHGISIEREISWPRGGRSLYVRDPAGNSIELASPRLWGLGEPRGALPSAG